MKLILNRIYDFSTGFVRLLGVLLTFLLFLGGFLFTCYATDMDTQRVLTRFDNPLLNLLGLGCFVLLFGAVVRLRFLSNRFLLYAVLGWGLLCGLLLVLLGKTVPAADSMSVYSIAEALSLGDTSVIHPTDSYLSYYPQQVGLVAFYEVIHRVWNLLPLSLPAYHIIKCINVLFACVIILFQYKTVHLLWENEVADRIFLLFAGCNFPLLMYTSFVYGEIPSFAALSTGIFALLKLFSLLKDSSVPVPPSKPDSGFDAIPVPLKTSSKISKGTGRQLLWSIISLLSFTVSVLLRKNSLILVLAVLLVVCFTWFQQQRTLLLTYALLCCLLCFSILPLVQKGYELRAQNTLRSGVPASCYFAMGMQESSRGNGWYNGYNFNTYQESGMDKAAADAISKAAIQERLTYFKEHPSYAFSFYFHKLLSQWQDGTYTSRQATLATFGGRKPFFDSLYTGTGSVFYIEYCNAYQNLLYLGAFLFFLSELHFIKGKKIPTEAKKKTGKLLSGLPIYLGIIGVFGGFLFHIIWEANARYIFLYSLLLMPYAACGLARLLKRFTPCERP